MKCPIIENVVTCHIFGNEFILSNFFTPKNSDLFCQTFIELKTKKHKRITIFEECPQK